MRGRSGARLAALLALPTLLAALHAAPRPLQLVRARGSGAPRAAVYAAADGDVDVSIKPPAADAAAPADPAASAKPKAKVTVRVKTPSKGQKLTPAPTIGEPADVTTSIKVTTPNVTATAAVKAPPSLMEQRSPEEQALLNATQNANITAMIAALKLGVNPNLRDPKGRTPLHFVAGVGLAPMAMVLIHFGAQLDIRDKEGLTPLHMAAGYANAQTVKVLVGAGADPSIASEKQGTPLQIVTQLGEYQLEQVMMR